MKLYEAKIKHDGYEAIYRQWADNADEAREKIAKMCGNPNIKIKEI